MNDVDMDLFLVANVSGFIATHVICAVRRDDRRACFTALVTLSTNKRGKSVPLQARGAQRVPGS